MTIEFEDAIFGTEKEITFRRKENCHTCDGSGVKPGSEVRTCSQCDGSGEMRKVVNTMLGQAMSVSTCDNCHGTGQEVDEYCETCDGSGKEIKSRRLKVTIPAGVYDGATIKVRGEGEDGERGGQAGDLYIFIRVNEDEIFQREGDDIFLNVPVTFTELALGAEIEVPTLEGIETFVIPEGTQTGKQFKFAGKGVENIRTKQKGDLYFKVNVDIPQNLSDRQKELLKEFSDISGEEHREHKKTFFEKVKDVFS